MKSGCMCEYILYASYRLCPIIGKWSMQMALNSYRLLWWMDSTVTVKDFSSEFLHQATGKDLLIALRIPQKPGSHISLQHESKKLSLRKSLEEQGFHGEVAVSYVYIQTDLLAAWKFLRGISFPGSSRPACG